MKWLNQVWILLSNKNNQRTLAFIGSGLVVLVGGLWKVYTHFDNQKTSEPQPSVKVNGNGNIAAEYIEATAQGDGSVVIATAPVSFGVPFEIYKADLRKKDEELRAELEKAKTQDAANNSRLDNEITEVQAKLEKLQDAFDKYQKSMIAMSETIGSLNETMPPERIEQAQESLKKGQTDKAKQLYIALRWTNKQKAAEMAKGLSQIAESQADFVAGQSHEAMPAYRLTGQGFF